MTSGFAQSTSPTSFRVVGGLLPIVQIVAKALLDRGSLPGDELARLAGPLVDQLRPALTARPVAGHADYVFGVHPRAQRMSRPKSFKSLGLKVAPARSADCDPPARPPAG